ncbi:aspartyl glutamyl-trna(asn gln) b subunit [Plasmopara halstedii]|uniref:Glutamyl-tRNA(Gln) amidotransferase subunit B, mitochondrial n=1 Tax=Plasmopara halstedii TaxID=4781 RepID=A0A0P1B3V6_PLAHL|nr:aspartyl glutamyl-trna(asn gln) b subunit [Plasmopara halstedii]CEG48658.1 aspartyl glutamyl-trna(asn gln) b subunit [Plasmopara halstedii]|eukprot:XP_024585027.1 aspartyl glutamyl-trna(asn gln) b subunit [Plasmopara halstedii]
MAQVANGMRQPLLQLLRGPSGKLWEVCIGLEVHAQILSNSKLMSGAAAATLSSARPNRNVSFFDAALPGTLPVINRECVHQAIRTGLALDATIHMRSLFEPSGGVLHFELPASSVEKNEALKQWKAKQTKMQQQEMISRCVRITRIQIEQDSGKSNHDLEKDSTVVDLNRAGTALLEIVLEPDLRSPLEAGRVLFKLQHLLRHLGVCDGNMEEGSMRCDLNVSVRPINLGVEADIKTLHLALSSSSANFFGDRVEVKNMNSIRNLMRAAEYEARRQIALIEEEGGGVRRETRSFDAVTGTTKRMRSKEEAKDYRFFPDPDLPPLVLSVKLIQKIRASMPELPDNLKNRLCTQYDLTPYESLVLVNEPDAARYFENIASKNSRPAKMVSNWVLNDLFGHLKAVNGNIANCPVAAAELGALIDLIQNGTISGKIAKDVLEVMFYDNEMKKSPQQIVDEKGWKQIQDPDEIRAICRAVLDDPKAITNLKAYWNGKTQLFKFFIGQLMKQCGGRVHPELASTMMQEILNERK